MTTRFTLATLFAGTAVLGLGIAPPSPMVAGAPCRTHSSPNCLAYLALGAI
jgi:hypothetical protein